MSHKIQNTEKFSWTPAVAILSMKMNEKEERKNSSSISNYKMFSIHNKELFPFIFNDQHCVWLWGSLLFPQNFRVARIVSTSKSHHMRWTWQVKLIKAVCGVIGWPLNICCGQFRYFKTHFSSHSASMYIHLYTKQTR